MYITINRKGTRRAVISEVTAVRTSARAPGRAGQIDTVRVVFKVPIPAGIQARISDAQVELAFENDTINLDPEMGVRLDALIEALTAMRLGVRHLRSDACASCGRRRDDHKVRHIFKES